MTRVRVLLIGDIVGKGGRKAVKKLVPELRKEFSCGFCIANGENSAGGAGITGPCMTEILGSGVDVVTSGDHIWDQRDIIPVIDTLPRLLRPANMQALQPGRGAGIFQGPDGLRIGVINLIGRVFMRAEMDCPFARADVLLEELKGKTDAIFVDFHAEASSEKLAMGRYLDGRVTAIFGTHTHVQTADEAVWPGGSAYITDLGMVGGEYSILGRNVDAVLHRFRTGMPARFSVVDDGTVLHGAVVEFEAATGKATRIQRIRRPFVA